MGKTLGNLFIKDRVVTLCIRQNKNQGQFSAFCQEQLFRVGGDLFLLDRGGEARKPPADYESSQHSKPPREPLAPCTGLYTLNSD